MERLSLLSKVEISVALMLIILCSCNEHKSSLMIGIAEVNYTPEVGMDLVGNYRGEDYASRGVHDSLYARALVASNKKVEKVAILSVDICLLEKETVEMMRSYIASETDIKPENILIHATHTHSGPRSDLQAPGAEVYLKKAAGAVVLADKQLSPAILAVGRAKEDRVSHNRRLRCIDGTTHMCWEKFEPGFVIEPWGPIDPELITITINQKKGRKGVIINFGCHATTLTGNNWLYSADYPGYIAESVRRIKGKDYIPLFLNGPSGNVTQVDYRVGFPDTYQECQRIGYILGVTALEAMKNSEVVSGDIIAASREMVPVKRIEISGQQLEWAKAVMKKVEKEGMPPLQADGIPDAVYAKQWIDMYKTQNVIDSIEIMVIRIGELAFVGLPGEFFCEFGMDIKKRSPFKNTIVIGLANDSRGYFPTEISFTQGPEGFTPMITGYETTPGSTMYEPGSGEKMADSAVRQLTELSQH
ncbi:MAG: neutral/alkaline non-lysosomal ceramidase N-terminal domain-containing protein [Bacteroidales bacterium]